MKKLSLLLSAVIWLSASGAVRPLAIGGYRHEAKRVASEVAVKNCWLYKLTTPTPAEYKNYSVVYLGELLKNAKNDILWNTPENRKHVMEYLNNGGVIVTAEEIEADPIIDNPAVTYIFREFPAEGFTMRYFVNSTDEEQAATFTCGGKIMDPATGDLLPFDGTHVFPKWGSLVIIDDGTPASAPIEKPAIPAIDLTGNWKVTSATENALTLDTCDYWFDGKLEEENGYILNVGSRALELKRPVDIRCAFKVNADYIPETLYLACETPEIFDITVNGKAVDTTKDCGFFCDHSFKKLDISGLMQVGENVIETHVLFTQSDEVYENIEKGKQFESEKNKLTYDMEIEAMYLVGDFGVALSETNKRRISKHRNARHNRHSRNGRVRVKNRICTACMGKRNISRRSVQKNHRNAGNSLTT